MFKDMVDAERGDYGAAERLRRHSAETADWMEKRDQTAWRVKPNDVEYRVNPSTTAGQGGNFAPPLWIIDQFATFPRAHRVLADLVPSFPLPQGVHTVNLPRLTTGNAENPQNDATPDSSSDIVDAAVTSNVVTISGHGDVSLQELDQSPPGAHLDWAFFKDLSEAYDAQLEAQLINGSGANGQLLGLLNVSGINTTSASASTATGMFTDIGKVVSKIGNNRKIPPTAWLMTTSRFAWLGSSEDQQQRPLMITDKDGSGEFDLLAIEVKLDDAIPTNLGTGANQDVIIACVSSDGILLESAPHARVHLEVLSGTLQARIQLHCYVAALLGRYPSGISVLNGSNMAVASGFNS
jgi:HK97 family phage major capsid protein